MQETRSKNVVLGREPAGLKGVKSCEFWDLGAPSVSPDGGSRSVCLASGLGYSRGLWKTMTNLGLCPVGTER